MFDGEGRVLLVEPRGHFSGYVWTFPKGRLDARESYAAAAMREVLEESGVTARIVESARGFNVSVGDYEGDLTLTRYFLMRMIACGAPLDAETESVRWATPDEAGALIAQTSNASGRARDQRVLEAALALYASVRIASD